MLESKIRFILLSPYTLLIEGLRGVYDTNSNFLERNNLQPGSAEHNPM